MKHLTGFSMTGISTADLCTADPSVRALRANLKPVLNEAVCGRALTAWTPPGHNAAIHRAVHIAEDGDLLVVDAAGDRIHGVFGDLLASCCMSRGVVGVVILGSIRDTIEVSRVGLPVYYIGRSPVPAQKSEAGRVGDDLHIGGVCVRSGDIVAADADGVVVVPAESAGETFQRARDVVSRESRLRERISAGETTLEILDL